MKLPTHLERVVGNISLGHFPLPLKISATHLVTHEDRKQAVMIQFSSPDAFDDAAEPVKLDLHGCYAVPEELLWSDRELDLVNWIRERCQDELLHELDEFFRYKGKNVVVAEHPVTEKTFKKVRDGSG